MGGARRGCSRGGGWGRRGRGGSGGSASLARSDVQLRMGLRAYLIRRFAATSDSRQYSTSAAGAFPRHRENLESHTESLKKKPLHVALELGARAGDVDVAVAVAVRGERAGADP